ncbi:uncharacterized protein LOC105781308 [Gossypium raimondii]|uniref:uncharacterized protein LOC105781308 n=1 Tax=Gossypium raimondii TaxID=29730 RepID=UPI00227CCA77|nr:uncharacterized protein LOC105781308 [Gossypium raimondii]
MIESTALSGRMARWQILLSEFDIVYVSQKAVKWSAIADFLASRALEDYEPLSFDFPNEDLMCIVAMEESSQEGYRWRLNFDGASNAMGNRIGAVLVSPNGDHYPFTCKLDFDCTNNMAEYEACIMGIRAAIEQGIKVLEVYGDSALVIYQLRGEWETRDPKLISYRKLILELIKEFEDITFCYLPRDENQMADALATLASMIKVNRYEDMKPIQMSIYEDPAHCYNIEEGEINDSPWYQDILRYVKNRQYPGQATDNEKRTLRRLAIDYVLDGEILYKRRKDHILLRCVDALEAKEILEEAWRTESCHVRREREEVLLLRRWEPKSSKKEELVSLLQLQLSLLLSAIAQASSLSAPFFYSGKSQYLCPACWPLMGESPMISLCSICC